MVISDIFGYLMTLIQSLHLFYNNVLETNDYLKVSHRDWLIA
jgi:hypothetical protein